MIELIDVKKSFDGQILFKNVNLHIPDGDFVVFSGASGCGKTTLLSLIGGLELPDSGKVLVNGKDINSRKNKLNYFQNEVGFLFQNFALVDNKTVRQNMELVYKRSRSNISVEDALKRVGLKDKISSKVYKLSGGEQQRVAIARLMIKKCSIILADEPTGSLDFKNSEMIIKLLQELNQEGKTIIMVTHNEEQKEKAKHVISIDSVMTYQV